MLTPLHLLDRLEPRRLLDATLANGVLTVEGTAASDDIVVYLFRAEPGADAVYDVEVGPIGGERPTRFWQFPAADVKSVAVRAGGGDDVVDLAAATIAAPANPLSEISPVPVPARIDGGLGNDTIYGGESRDTVTGGFGNDRIEGRGGDDLLLGGYGNDRIHGGDGNDLVLAGPGDDSISGDQGDDRLFGESGNDWLGAFSEGPSDEPGNDLLVGGPGEDSLMGGSGDDRLFGGSGRDRFFFSDRPSEMIDRTPDERVDAPPPGVF
jgi:Ca2+-binding RTX toxin-like protein